MSKLFVDAKCYSLSNKAIKCIGKVLITRDIHGRGKVTGKCNPHPFYRKNKSQMSDLLISFMVNELPIAITKKHLA